MKKIIYFGFLLHTHTPHTYTSMTSPHCNIYIYIYLYNILGKESENSYQKLKRSLKDRHTKTVSRYFDRHGCLYQSERVNVCEHTTKMVSLESL